MFSTNPNRLRAFSLIELLAVIAIVGALAALVLASLARARASARAATCLSNLRQIGQAALQFARELGATVIGTAGPANQDRVRQLGATPVEYGPGLVERVRALAPQGVDRVLDMCRTTLNVTGDLTLAACVAATEQRAEAKRA